MIQKIQSLFIIKLVISLVILLGLFALWIYKGIAESGVHADLARDLNYLSDLWIHKVVWLGPATSAHFPASPIYYYLLFPGLLLSGGDALSLIFSQAFFALLALLVYIYLQIKNSLLAALLPVLAIGLSNWWIIASSMPWNGYMYASFVFLALTSLWFKKPLFLSALLFGTAIAIDPVAILPIPLLFFEWVSSKNRKKNTFYILLGLLLPWAPIIIFELITKGFLTRSFLESPQSTEIFFSPQLTNINNLLTILRVSQIQALLVLVIAFLLASKRGRFWIIFTLLSLIPLILFTPFRQYYLLGLVCAVSFTMATVLSFKPIGKIVLIIFIFLIVQGMSLPVLSFGGRSIPRLNNTVNTFIQKSNLDKTKKYAVVSVINQLNSTPQADDYRFFLRTKGIKVLSIDEYPEADILLLFIEVANFNWKDFDDWHIQRFGQKKFLSDQNINGTEVVMYGR